MKNYVLFFQLFWHNFHNNKKIQIFLSDKFRISLNKVTVANLLEAVHVNEKIDMNKGSGSRRRLVRMRFEFLPHKSYKDKYAVTPPMVLKYFENTYIGKKFLIVLSSVIKDKIVDIETNTEKKSKKSKKDDDDPDAEDVNTGPDKTMDQLEKGLSTYLFVYFCYSSTTGICIHFLNVCLHSLFTHYRWLW